MLQSHNLLSSPTVYLQLIVLLSYLHSSDTNHVLECIPISERASLTSSSKNSTLLPPWCFSWCLSWHKLINSQFPPWECKLLDHKCFFFILSYSTESFVIHKRYMQPHKKDNKKRFAGKCKSNHVYAGCLKFKSFHQGSGSITAHLPRMYKGSDSSALLQAHSPAVKRWCPSYLPVQDTQEKFTTETFSFI